MLIKKKGPLIDLEEKSKDKIVIKVNKDNKIVKDLISDLLKELLKLSIRL